MPTKVAESFKSSRELVALGFEETSMRIALGAILPLRVVTERIKASVKYAQIKASISEVGIIEPPVVARIKGDKAGFNLLDGHLRIEILRDNGAADVVCLVALDDEAFTYNKRISRIATIQEHRMILNAVRKGVSEERLAKALNVNIASIRFKRNLLVGICPEAANLLRDKHVPMAVFTELRHLKPVRQIEAAELMITMNKYSSSYAKAIVAASPPAALIAGRQKRPRGLSDRQVSLMQQESESLDREFRAVEKTYSADHLDLAMAFGYIERLLGNARVVGFMAQHHPDILSEFQSKIQQHSSAA
jgi:hypothetical protein